jgi:hypothetical protein
VGVELGPSRWGKKIDKECLRTALRRVAGYKRAEIIGS